MICQKKNKRLCVFCSFCLLLCLVLQCSVFCVPSYASETEYVTVENYLTDSNFSDIVDWVCRNYAILPDSVTAGNLSVQGFYNYLTSIDKEDLKQESVTITGSGGGRGYDIPQDVRQEIVNYVQNNYIQQNPLTYTEAYVTGYNFLDTSVFSNYATYVNVKYIIEHCNGWAFMFATGYGTSSSNNIGIVTIDRSKYDVNFIGSVTGGVFTNVGLEHLWSMINQFPSNTEGVDFYCVRQSSGTYGTGKSYAAAAANAGYSTTWVPSFSQGIKNTASPYNSTNIMSVMTSRPDKELVYVFSTLNAYKAYNAGAPQPYYLPSNSSTVVPLYDTYTQQDLNRAGNFYNSIVNNVSSGDSPDSIQKTVDSVIKSGLSSGSDSDSSSGSILGGLSDIIAGATGAITPIGDLVTGDLKQFVQDIFDWLPPQIITIWIAGITFAVFFGVLKVIRG